MMHLAAFVALAAAKKSMIIGQGMAQPNVEKVFQQAKKLAKELGSRHLAEGVSFRDRIVYDLQCKNGPFAVATSNELYVRFMRTKDSKWELTKWPVSKFDQINCRTKLKKITWRNNEKAIETALKKGDPDSYIVKLPARLALFPVQEFYETHSLFENSQEQKFYGKFELKMMIWMSTLSMKRQQRERLVEGSLKRVLCQFSGELKWIWANVVKNRPQHVLLIDTNFDNADKNHKVSLTKMRMGKVCE